MEAVAARVYGRALFELAQEEGRVDAAASEVSRVRTALRENPELIRLLKHPKLSVAEKLTVVEAVFHGRVSGEMMGFLAAAVKNGRYGELDAMLGYFEACVREYRRIGTVSVITACRLTNAQKKRIEDRLLALTDYTALETEYQTDPSLIGGLIIRIGDRQVDASIKTRLDMMIRSLRNKAAGSGRK